MHMPDYDTALYFVNENTFAEDSSVEATFENVYSSNSQYGVVCRYQDYGWYEFRIVVSGEWAGTYTVYKYDQYLNNHLDMFTGVSYSVSESSRRSPRLCYSWIRGQQQAIKNGWGMNELNVLGSIYAMADSMEDDYHRFENDFGPEGIQKKISEAEKAITKANTKLATLQTRHSNEKNADRKEYPAALSQIMTAVIVLENCPDISGVSVTATEEMSSRSGSYPSERSVLFHPRSWTVTRRSSAK